MDKKTKPGSEADTWEKTVGGALETTRMPQETIIATPQETVIGTPQETAVGRRPEAILGTTLGGRYRIQRRLGHGGFGVVYLATDEKMLSRPVVVKALADGGTDNEWVARKFRQEIEALARVDHPSIVGIFDVGEMPDGKPYIVMQYVDGFSLRSIITPEGLDFWRAANIIRQTGRALSAAHDRGILHRDLKPENIMVQSLGGGDEQVKIIDFGIARVRNSLVSFTTASDKTVGTIAYMSPEQLIAGPLTAASDVYCLAVIAYELLTGRRPANPGSAYQLLDMQRAGVKIRPSDLRPSLPQQAETVILKGLSFEPELRPQRAREFGDFLASALVSEDEQTITASDASPVAGTVPSPAATPPPETAHILFIEVVGFAALMTDEQPAVLQKLQAIVNRTEDFNRAQASKQLIRLPTAEGLVLVFFGDPESPLRCALQISQAVKSKPEFKLRMGIHSGLVYRIADINTNMNVAGGGLNIAQRVMDVGDAGHILVSARVADDLKQVGRWAPCLHELGEAEGKHGMKVHVFNLFTSEVGNPQVPARIRSLPSQTNLKRLAKIAAVALVSGLLSVAVAYFALTRRTSEPEPPGTSSATNLREQSLAYSLTVQKMRNERPDGGEIEMTGHEVYGNGWRFRFNLSPSQKGALYLLNQTTNASGFAEFNVLFPTPQNGGKSDVDAGQQLQTRWYIFDKQTGVEKLWLIWSAAPVAQLDEVFADAATQQGVLNVSQAGTVKSYLKKHEEQRPEVNTDKARKLTTVKGKGDILVHLLELAHEKY